MPLRWVAVFAVGLSLALAGCGFHLRGQAELPAALERVAVSGIAPRTPLGEAIAVALTAAGGQVVAGDASAVLHISQEHYERQMISVDRTGRAAEYGLYYEVGYELRTPQGKPWIAVQRVTLSRDLAFDPAHVLGKGEEEALLQQEMRDLAAQQMVWRLRAALQRTPVPPP